MPVSPARVAAFEILMRIQTTDAYASEMLHSSRFAMLSPADHGLLSELVMGVLRWRGLLDDKIAEHYGCPSADRSASRKIPALGAQNVTRTGHPSNLSNQPLAKLDLEVLTALRLGAYQILFLDRVPKHAAVNESVELVKSAHKRSAAGLVNAVLRKIERGPGDLDTRAAHPEWLVERWARVYGAEAARRICKYDQAAPTAVIRPQSPHPFGKLSAGSSKTAKGGAPTSLGATDAKNEVELRSTGRTRASAPTRLVEELRDEGIQLEPGKLLSSAFTVKSGDITATSAFHERRVMIQDEASQLVALLVGDGKKILDCCAAPGGKTRILAERNPEAMVVAMELHPHRAALLRKLVPAENVRVIAGDVRKMPFAGTFDRILVDAPCSGTGTLARNPEIKWRLRAEVLLRLQKYQIEILQAAMKHVAQGGRVVYSTCSLEPEENEDVIEKALAADSSFRVMNCGDELEKLRASSEFIWAGDSMASGSCLRTVPGVHPCDGFFAAVLARK
jgi:16S rRNA (cytosine967-C5)-methyltransferase